MTVGSTRPTASLRRACRGRCELPSIRTTLATRTTLPCAPHEAGRGVKTHTLRLALPFVSSDRRRTRVPTMRRAALEQPRDLLLGSLQTTRFPAASSTADSPGCEHRPHATQAPAAARGAHDLRMPQVRGALPWRLEVSLVSTFLPRPRGGRSMPGMRPRHPPGRVDRGGVGNILTHARRVEWLWTWRCAHAQLGQPCGLPT